MTFKTVCDILSHGSNLGVAQMVARYLGVVEAAGSNPVTQTISSIDNGLQFSILDFLSQHSFTVVGGE